jgi:hypothetical protein
MMRLSYRTLALLVLLLLIAAGMPLMAYNSSYPLFASPEIPSKSREWGYIIVSGYFVYLLLRSVHKDYSIEKVEKVDG